MRVLIADDDAALRHGLRVQLERWGYEPVVCEDGAEARALLSGGNPPPMAILDWSMPGADGVTLCREIRASSALSTMYVILLTAHDTRDEMVAGLTGGADEYITKPFDWGVLRARVKTGARIASLQQSLAQRVTELQNALAMVKQLSGLLPICSYCKRIRRDGNYWQQLEAYLSEHSEAEFSHGVCPTCFEQAKKEFGIT
ncbi:MAG TPA: response regulator transcription factor [Vicinamibacterales bacterium]|nr:response regulator transcription factor [Vicinamibacterales bacterium]